MDKVIISKGEYDRLMEGKVSYEEFNQMVENLVNHCVERSLQTIPNVVDYMVRQATYLKGLSEQFYNDNKDLVDHKETVTKIIERMESENPDKSYEEILQKAATKSRELINEKVKFSGEMQSNFDLSKTDEDLGMLE